MLLAMSSEQLTLFNAKTIFDNSTRFDLIFKYLYVLSRGTESSYFYRSLYLESIKYFNGFYEESPPKYSPVDFLDAFENTIASVQTRGFDTDISNITISTNLNLYDGAHRLAVCASQNLDIYVKLTKSITDYNYSFFLDNGMPQSLADFAAYKFAEISRFTTIALIHSCVPESLDRKIEEVMLDAKCKIYYKKKIDLSFNAYVNLKKICYADDAWIGDQANAFSGAHNHATMSFGSNCLRVYLLITDHISSIHSMKASVRSFVGHGNWSIHTTDDYSDKIRLAQTLFFHNSLQLITALDKSTDFKRDFPKLNQFKAAVLSHLSKDKLDNFCVVGSYPLSIYGLRHCSDLDYLTLESKVGDLGNGIDLHDHEDELYIAGWRSQILDPSMYFYLNSVKVISLPALYYYKIKRAEFPKDSLDLRHINQYLSGMSFRNQNSLPAIQSEAFDPGLAIEYLLRWGCSALVKYTSLLLNKVSSLLKSKC